MKYHWNDFDEGRSIGQKGSEGGKIIRDEENSFGARVTLETDGHVAPFSITLGIYGLMLHTGFFGDLKKAQECFDLYKKSIEKIIDNYSADENIRDQRWAERQTQLIEQILDIC